MLERREFSQGYLEAWHGIILQLISRQVDGGEAELRLNDL